MSRSFARGLFAAFAGLLLVFAMIDDWSGQANKHTEGLELSAKVGDEPVKEVRYKYIYASSD